MTDERLSSTRHIPAPPSAVFALVEWTVESERFNLGHRYGYRLEQADDATLTTAYSDWSGVEEKWKRIFPVLPASALAATLGILDRTVRRGYPRPRPSTTTSPVSPTTTLARSSPRWRQP